jgi:hypothetical protein
MKTLELIMSVLVAGLLWYQPSVFAQQDMSGSPAGEDFFDQDAQRDSGVSQGVDQPSEEGSEYLSHEDEEGKIDQPPPPPVGNPPPPVGNSTQVDRPYDTQPPAEQPAGNDAFEYFRDKLAPYGEWTWTTEFGWVWHPREVASDWQPYTYGRWVYTEYGWTWSSYYPWGWAPFHYGRWAFVGSNWVWVPGMRWAPAWVMWRNSEGYIGWSPLLAGFDLWYGWSYYPVRYNYWTFVGWNHFNEPHPYHYFVPRNQLREVFRHTYYPNNCRNGGGPLCQRGPARAYVNRHVSTPVVMTRVNNLSTRGHGGPAVSGLGLQGNRLNIYRPRFGTGAAEFRRQPHSDLQRVNPQDVRSGQMRNSYLPHANERPNFNRPSVDRPSISRPTGRPQGYDIERRPLPGKDIYSRPPSNRSPSMLQSEPSPRIETHSFSPTPNTPAVERRSSAYRDGSKPPSQGIRSAPNIRPAPSVRPAPSLHSMPSTRGTSRGREH